MYTLYASGIHSFIYFLLTDCYVIGFGSFCGKTKTQKVDKTELVPAVTCQKRDHTQQLFLISAAPSTGKPSHL